MPTLLYPPFSTNPQLLAASTNNPVLRQGMRGSGIALVQGALIDLQFAMPVSTRKTGAPDGIFGKETKEVIRKYQDTRGLNVSFTVNKETLEKLDREMATLSTSPLPKLPYPRPVRPRHADYVLGTADPALQHDAGAGPWNSKPKQLTYIAWKLAILDGLGHAALIIGDDAAAHMKHYLKNSGQERSIDLERMIGDVPSARGRYEAEVRQFKAFAGTLPVGTHDITSTETQPGDNPMVESWNWFYASNAYQSWAKGRVVVTDDRGTKRFKAEIEYNFYDRYNWDGGKAVKIFDIMVNDELLGELHRQGLAREFDLRGKFTRTLEWSEGDLYDFKPFVRA